MPKYIRLTNLTEQGRRNIDKSTDRTERVRELAAETGGSIEDLFLTFGPYDFVAVAEFPDDESYAEFALKAEREGGYETQTLKAVEEDDYSALIQDLG